MEVDNQYPYWLYGGQQDNSTTISVPSLPPYPMQAGPNAWIMQTGGCETGPAVPNPINPNIVYSNCKGRFGVYNKRPVKKSSFMLGQLICMDTTQKTSSLDSKEFHQFIFHLTMKKLFIMGPSLFTKHKPRYYLGENFT